MIGGVLVQGVVYLQYLPDTVHGPFGSVDKTTLKGSLVGSLIGVSWAIGIFLTVYSFFWYYLVIETCPQILFILHRSFWLSKDERKAVLTKAFNIEIQVHVTIVQSFLLFFGFVAYESNLTQPQHSTQWWFWFICALFLALLVGNFVFLLVWLELTHKKLSHKKDSKTDVAPDSQFRV